MKRIGIFGLFYFFMLARITAQEPLWDWIQAIQSDNFEIATDVAADRITGDVYLAGEWNGDLSASLPASLRESVVFDSTYGGSDGFLIKLDKDGNLQWGFKVGGEGDDLIQAVHLDQDRNLYVTGTVSPGSIRFSGTGTMSPDSGYTNALSKDFFLASYDPAGNLLWYRHSEGNSNVQGSAVSSNSSGIYVTGNFRGSTRIGSLQTGTTTGNEDFFLVKYLRSGDEQWMISGHSNKQDVGTDIACDEAQVYLIGEFNGDSLILTDAAGDLSPPLLNVSTVVSRIFLASFNNAGEVLAVSSIASPGNDHAHALEVDQENLYLAGSLGGPAIFPAYAGNPVPYVGGDDAFLCSISKTDGTTGWVRTFSDASNGDQVIRDVSMDMERKLYITGSFASGIQVDTAQAVSLGFTDIFIASYDHDGTYNWFKTAGGDKTDSGNGLSAAYPGSLYVAGEYTDFASFDGVDMPTADNQNIFAGRLVLPCVDAVSGTLSASDTLVCEGESLALTLDVHTGILQWQSSVPGMNDWSLLVSDDFESITFVPSASADYRVLVSSGDCAPDSSNVMHVEVVPPPTVDAGSDRVIYEGETIRLSGSGGDSLRWDPDYRLSDPRLPDPLADPLVDTTYYLTAFTAEGCSATDSVKVSVMTPDFAYAGEDINLCQGDSVRLLASGGDSYAWNPVPGLSQYDVNDPWARPQLTTSYVVQVSTSGGATDTDTVQVIVFERSIAEAGPDQDLTASFETSLEAVLDARDTGWWSVVQGHGIFEEAQVPNTRVWDLQIGENIFEWRVSNGVCPEVSDQVIIRVSDFVVPTVITPNEDGKNDLFHVEGIEQYPSSELVVLDRWGAVVYSAAPYLNTWDGTDQNGKVLPEETYYIVLKISDTDIRKGYVMLLR